MFAKRYKHYAGRQYRTFILSDQDRIVSTHYSNNGYTEFDELQPRKNAALRKSISGMEQNHLTKNNAWQKLLLRQKTLA